MNDETIGDGLLKCWKEVVKAILKPTPTQSTPNQLTEKTHKNILKTSVKGFKNKIQIKRSKVKPDVGKAQNKSPYSDEEIEVFYEKFVDWLKENEEYDEKTHFLCHEVDVLFWRDVLGLKHPEYGFKILQLGEKKGEIEIEYAKGKSLVLYKMDMKVTFDLT